MLENCIRFLNFGQNSTTIADLFLRKNFPSKREFMDKQRLLTTIILVAVMMLAYPLISRLWTHEKPATTEPAANMLYPVMPEIPQASEQGAVPKSVNLGDPGAASKDKVALTVSNQTAGIERVQLNVKDWSEYPKDRRHPVPEPLTLLEARKGLPLPYSTLGVHVFVDGSELPLATSAADLASLSGKARADRIAEDNAFALLKTQYVWKIVPGAANEVRMLLTINNGPTPVAEITKIFRIDPSSYNVTISHEVKNLTDKPIKVQIDQMAAEDAPADLTTRDTRFFHAAGLKGDMIDAEKRFHLPQAELAKMKVNTKEVGSLLGKDPVEWVSASGRFFTAITRPLPENNAPPAIELYGNHPIPVQTHVASAQVDVLKKTTDAIDCVGGIRLVGNAIELPPKGSNDFPLAVYFGPMKQDVLQGSYLAAPGTDAYNYAVFQYVKLIQVSGAVCWVYSLCLIEPLTYYMLRFLDFLHATIAFGNYGIAIIILVFIVKALMHPLTRRGQISMATMSKKMKDIQPIVEASKKKYAKDRQKQNEEMMRIYREHNVNPAGGVMGCLPMMLQTPIWIAVWTGLSTDIDLRHAAFIPGWINDLSGPDQTITFAPVHIPLLSSLIGPISALNLLPILLGLVVFVQMKVQMASQPRPADDQQAQMQKISSYMVLVFPLFLYTMPSGINLYYFASTLGGLVDTYFVRKSLKKKGILPTNAPVLPTHEQKE
jgi:YidC/Oxa1 family membrane protein insertase